jgi:TolB-like protein
VRRLIAVVLIAFFGLPPVAASPETFAIKPRAIVYPFTATGSSVDREASSRLATIIATRMAETGLVTVVPPPPGTERKDFLSVARAQNADYYVAGFISPLGNGVSLVEQLVSSATGIVIFSQSTQLNSYQEAAAQGDDLAQYIAHHANRAFSSIGTPPPQASPTPAPSSGPEANLGKLFGRRKKAAATPSPAPKPVAVASEPAAALVNVATPAPARPAAAPTPSPKPVAVAPTAAASERFAVTAVEGTADAALRERAAERLVSRTSAERATSAAAACKPQPVRAVLSGVLAVRPDPQFGGASATFELDAVDCSGKVLWRQSFTRDAGGAQGMQIATERAVDAAIGAYLNPPRRR